MITAWIIAQTEININGNCLDNNTTDENKH